MTVTWKITEVEQELFYPWGRFQTQPLQKAVSAESIPPHPGGTEVKNSPAMQEMQETGVPSLGREDPLEEETAAHSSTLAWEIP